MFINHLSFVSLTCYRVGGGLQSGRQSYQFSNEVWSLGDAEERSFGPTVACPAREETAQSHSTCQLPSLPHDGDQPEGNTLFPGLGIWTKIGRYILVSKQVTDMALSGSVNVIYA